MDVEVVALKKGRDEPLVLDFLSLISRHRIQVLNTHGSVDSSKGRVEGLAENVLIDAEQMTSLHHQGALDTQ